MRVRRVWIYLLIIAAAEFVYRLLVGLTCDEWWRLGWRGSVGLMVALV